MSVSNNASHITCPCRTITVAKQRPRLTSSITMFHGKLSWVLHTTWLVSTFHQSGTTIIVGHTTNYTARQLWGLYIAYSLPVLTAY